MSRSNGFDSCSVPLVSKESLDFISLLDDKLPYCHFLSVFDDFFVASLVSFDFQCHILAVLDAVGTLRVYDVLKKLVLLEQCIPQGERVYLSVLGLDVVVCGRNGSVYYFDVSGLASCSVSCLEDTGLGVDGGCAMQASSLCFLEGPPITLSVSTDARKDSSALRRGTCRCRFLIGGSVGGSVFEGRVTCSQNNLCELSCRRLICLPVHEPVSGLAALWVGGNVPALMMSTNTHLFRTVVYDLRNRDVAVTEMIAQGSGSKKKRGFEELLRRVRSDGLLAFHVCFVNDVWPSSATSSAVPLSSAASGVSCARKCCGSVSVHHPDAQSPPLSYAWASAVGVVHGLVVRRLSRLERVDAGLKRQDYSQCRSPIWWTSEHIIPLGGFASVITRLADGSPGVSQEANESKEGMDASVWELLATQPPQQCGLTAFHMLLRYACGWVVVLRHPAGLPWTAVDSMTSVQDASAPFSKSFSATITRSTTATSASSLSEGDVDDAEHIIAKQEVQRAWAALQSRIVCARHFGSEWSVSTTCDVSMSSDGQVADSMTPLLRNISKRHTVCMSTRTGFYEVSLVGESCRVWQLFLACALQCDMSLSPLPWADRAEAHEGSSCPQQVARDSAFFAPPSANQAEQAVRLWTAARQLTVPGSAERSLVQFLRGCAARRRGACDSRVAALWSRCDWVACLYATLVSGSGASVPLAELMQQYVMDSVVRAREREQQKRGRSVHDAVASSCVPGHSCQSELGRLCVAWQSCGSLRQSSRMLRVAQGCDAAYSPAAQLHLAAPPQPSQRSANSAATTSSATDAASGVLSMPCSAQTVTRTALYIALGVCLLQRRYTRALHVLRRLLKRLVVLQKCQSPGLSVHEAVPCGVLVQLLRDKLGYRAVASLQRCWSRLVVSPEDADPAVVIACVWTTWGAFSPSPRTVHAPRGSACASHRGVARMMRVWGQQQRRRGGVLALAGQMLLRETYMMRIACMHEMSSSAMPSAIVRDGNGSDGKDASSCSVAVPCAGREAKLWHRWVRTVCCRNTAAAALRRCRLSPLPAPPALISMQLYGQCDLHEWAAWVGTAALVRVQPGAFPSTGADGLYEFARLDEQICHAVRAVLPVSRRVRLLSRLLPALLLSSCPTNTHNAALALRLLDDNTQHQHARRAGECAKHSIQQDVSLDCASDTGCMNCCGYEENCAALMDLLGPSAEEKLWQRCSMPASRVPWHAVRDLLCQRLADRHAAAAAARRKECAAAATLRRLRWDRREVGKVGGGVHSSGVRRSGYVTANQRCVLCHTAVLSRAEAFVVYPVCGHVIHERCAVSKLAAMGGLEAFVTEACMPQHVMRGVSSVEELAWVDCVVCGEAAIVELDIPICEEDPSWAV